MSKLTKYKLQDLYKISSGISTKPEQYGQGAPFLSFSTIFNNYFIPDELKELMNTNDKEQKTYSVMKGDVFLTRTSETLDELAMSCVALKDYPKATFSGFAKRLRPIQKNITYDKFMGFFLRSKYFRKIIDSNAIMTLRASFNEKIFSYINIDLIDYKEQVKIGDLLYYLEEKIKLNNKINSELEKMAKTLYDYWFVQFDFPDENKRPYKSANGKMVYNEVLKREIPVGWEVIKFDDLVEQSPKLKAIKAPDYKNQGDIPIVDQASTLITGRTDDMSYYYKNERNCVVFGDVTTCFKYINFPFAKGTDGTKIINAKDDRIPAILLYQLLKDTKLPNIGFARHYMFLREINLLLPPKNICNDYYETTKGIMDLRAKNIEENYKLSVTRDFLLPLLMNGQVSVQN